MRIHRNLRASTLAGLLLAAAVACSASDAPTAPAPPTPIVRLKDIVIPNLPSPYYHFAYHADGRVDSASFASDLRTYDVSYDANGRIRQMHNNSPANHDRIVYNYDAAGQVLAVRYVDTIGVTFTAIIYSFEAGRLAGVERSQRVEGGLIIDKTISLSYDGDGNLLELREHRPAIAGRQDDITIIDRFEQYDTGLNVDGFSLLHDDFFDHLVLLPGVQLQKGNPRRQTRTGNSDNFTVDYTYAYEGGRPVTKLGAVKFTTGQFAGRNVQTRSDFTYY